MKIKQRMVSFFVISLLVLNVVSIAPIRVGSVKAQQPNASLISVISDEGVNPDAKGLYGYLNVTIGINVTEPGYFEVESDFLIGINVTDNASNSISSSAQASGSLNVGIEGLTLSFYGRPINLARYDPYSLGDLILYAEENNTLVQIDQLFAPNASLLLRHTYNYSEFDPVAVLIGISYDKGVGTDSYGQFNYLQVGVEVDVTDAEAYTVDVQLLYSNYIEEYLDNYSTVNLSPGPHIVNVTFNGAMIHFYETNFSTVYSISLQEAINESKGITLVQWLGSLSNVPLPTPYNYTEFNPHAYLTGRVYDYGIDTDNDGLFDYLQTNIEVNVTEDGTYQVSVQGLAGTNPRQWYPFFSLVSSPLYLNVGIHLFNLSFYGPEIAYYGISPRDVTGVSLSELSNSSGFSGELGYMQSIPLLTPYNSSEFYHPLNDMGLNFTVNPNGSVGINAMLNATHMYPENPYGLVVNASAELSKKNNSILGSVNGTVGLPPYVTVPSSTLGFPTQTQFPTNQTTADYISQYNNGILTEELNATSVFPPIVKTLYPYNTTDFKLLGTYSNGVMHTQLSGTSIIPQNVASELPFNVTDVTVEANLGSSNEFKGNITLHIISGLPISDVMVNFEGNRSDMFFTGNVSVPYGTYEGMVVNATNVAKLISEIKSNVTCEGPSSLYNMTDGILELTNVEVTNTTMLGCMGVRIDYNASVRGDFAALIAEYINDVYFSSTYGDQYYPVIYAALNSTLSSVNDMSFTMSYDHTQSLVSMAISFDSNLKTLWSNALELIPTKIPQNETDEINALLKLGNATAYAVQSAWLNITYLGTETQPSLDLSAGAVENASQLNNDTVKLIPDLLSYVYSASPQEQNIIESYLNTTYATLDSVNTTIHLQNGIATFRTDFAFGGNLDEQINAAKTYYVNLLNYTYSLMNESLPTQVSLLNQTGIDINNLRVNLQYGKDNAFLNVTGIVVYPPVQAIDNFRAFKLTNFFNATSLLGSSEPPTEFEKLKIIIQGGSNSNYTVIPSRSGTVPTPNEISSDGKTFTWENTTISSLRDMIFNIAYQGSFQNYRVPILSNSTINNFSFNPKNTTISFNVTGTPGTIGYCNITIPRSLLDSPQNTWVIKEDKIALQAGNIPLKAGQYNVTQNADYTFIYITYTHSSHTISIIGTTTTVQEMPPNTMMFIMLITSLIAMILITTQRRKIRSLKTKSLDIANRILRHFSNF
jgi:hypothetical protein